MSGLERVTQQHGRPSPGDNAGPRRMPAGCGAERMAPVLVTRGLSPQGSLQEFDRFHEFCIHSVD